MEEGDPLSILKLIKEEKEIKTSHLCFLYLQTKHDFIYKVAESLSAVIQSHPLSHASVPHLHPHPHASVSPLIDVKPQLSNQRPFVTGPIKEMLKKMLLMLRPMFKANN